MDDAIPHGNVDWQVARAGILFEREANLTRDLVIASLETAGKLLQFNWRVERRWRKAPDDFDPLGGAWCSLDDRIGGREVGLGFVGRFGGVGSANHLVESVFGAASETEMVEFDLRGKLGLDNSAANWHRAGQWIDDEAIHHFINARSFGGQALGISIITLGTGGAIKVDDAKLIR